MRVQLLAGVLVATVWCGVSCGGKVVLDTPKGDFGGAGGTGGVGSTGDFGGGITGTGAFGVGGGNVCTPDGDPCQTDADCCTGLVCDSSNQCD